MVIFPVAFIAVKLLEKVYSVVYEGNYIKWQGNTSKYDVSIIKRGEQEPVYTQTNDTAKIIDVSTYDAGVYQVSVKMHGDGGNITSPSVVKYFAVGAETTIVKNGDVSKITWNSGLGVSYKVSIQDALVEETTANEYEIQENDFASSGSYTVSVIAIDSEENEIYLRSSIITKVTAPELKFNKSTMLWSNIKTANNQTLIYKVNGVEVASLPTEFTAGIEYTVSAYVVTSNTNEVNSDETEVSIYKLECPSIKVDYSENSLISVNQLQDGVGIKYYILSEEIRTPISKLSDLGSGKEYKIVGVLSADSYNDYTYILNSDESEQIKVQRYNAPTIDDYESEEFVTVGGTRSGYTFYYKRSTESDNSYQVLPNGEVGSLTAGTYSVYAIKKGEE